MCKHVALERCWPRKGGRGSRRPFRKIHLPGALAYDFPSLLRPTMYCPECGSDNWEPHIRSDLIRRVEARAAFGLTLPLVAKSDGEFGKTGSGNDLAPPRRRYYYVPDW